MNQLTFEIGDIAYDSWYNYTGIIKEFKTSPHGIEYIVLHDPTKAENDICTSQLKTESVNALHPIYLQLVCKKEDYEKIGQKQIFKPNNK